MIKASYILFFLAVILLLACLILYQNSWEKVLEFHERGNKVHTALRLLKELEGFTKSGGIHQVYASTTDSSKAVVHAVDSILHTLHEVVLYDDQRMRIDTLIDYFDELALHARNPSSNVLKAEHALTSFSTTVDQILLRATRFAQGLLMEQELNFKIQNARMNQWVNWILFSSFCLFVIGFVTSVYQNLEKRRLKIRNEATLNNAGIGICLYEATVRNPSSDDFILTYANYSAQQEYFRERILNQNPQILAHFREVVATGRSRRMELSYVHKSTVGWYIVNISRVAENSLAIYFQDITQIKLYEGELKSKVSQLKKVNRDLDQFAQATSHDLQEPFRKIGMLAELIRHDHNVTKNDHYLNSIMRTSERGLDLVRQVLLYSQVQSNDEEYIDVDLNLVVEGIRQDFELVLQESGGKIRMGTLPVVHANRIQMVQLFTNLIQNALKFRAEDRVPEIEIKYDLVRGIDVTASQNLNHLYDYFCISISDNGIGFDVEFQDKIFDAFQRLNSGTKYSGFGLGLSLCKKIALNHQGDITAASIPGKGSTFHVFLPKG